MACCCCCFSFSNIIEFFVVFVYPIYKTFMTIKQHKIEKLWLIYFVIMGLYIILEKTILFPIVFILMKISRSFYIGLRCFMHFWLYYSYYRGALYLEQKFGKYIDIFFIRSNALAGKIFQKIGIPDRDATARSKKIE